MSLGDLALRETSQAQKDERSTILLIWGPKNRWVHRARKQRAGGCLGLGERRGSWGWTETESQLGKMRKFWMWWWWQCPTVSVLPAAELFTEKWLQGWISHHVRVAAITSVNLSGNWIHGFLFPPGDSVRTQSFSAPQVSKFLCFQIPCWKESILLSPTQFESLPGGTSSKESSAEGARYTGSIPGSGRSPGEGNGNHSSILAWEIPWAEEPGGLQSMGSQQPGTLPFHLAYVSPPTVTINIGLTTGIPSFLSIHQEELKKQKQTHKKPYTKMWLTKFK